MGTGDLIARIYSNFRGVDFRGEEINLVRSPDSLNVWKDYKEIESIRTRPEIKLLSSFDDTIWGVYFYTVDDTDMMIVHSGTRLYKVVNGAKTKLDVFVNNARSDGFVYNNLWFFKDGAHYLQYDGETICEVVGYVPTTSIGRRTGDIGGGTKHEDVNMLSPWRINTFMGDGKSPLFCLDVPEMDDVIFSPPDVDGSLAGMDKLAKYIESTYDFLCSITVNGKPIYEKVKDAEGNTIISNVTHEDENGEFNEYEAYFRKDDKWFGRDRFEVKLGTSVEKNDASEIVSDGKLDNVIAIYPAPPAPLTDGQDNVSIKYKKSNDSSKIRNCTLLQVFDNRVFFSGNKDYPNMLWHSSLNDPTYCSDLDYYNEGIDMAPIKSMVAGNNNLWVFKEPSQANTTVFYHTPGTDYEYGKIYPSVHSSISTGCIGKAINFNDDIIFFSDRGMEGISGDITTEQVIAHRSSLVDRKLIVEPDYEDMILEEWEGYLIIFVGNKAYLADSRGIFTNEDHIEYEFFYWEFDKKITCAKVNKGILYIGTEDGVYTLTDTTSGVESWWVTPKDKFNHPQYLKTTNKRGCVVEATGDITVYAKTDRTDFELINTYENITDSFVSRIKRKKFKDIQLKFHSNTRFSLETASLECFIGGYIKR